MRPTQRVPVPGHFLFRHVVPSLVGILLLVHGDDHDSGGECDIGGECDGDSGGECDGVRIDCCG